MIERTKRRRKPDLLLCSDFHLRESTPICWSSPEEFQEEQWTSLAFISTLQRQYNCPVVCAGDLFHHWKPSPWLLSKTAQYLPNNLITVYGQHDLPQHNMDLVDKCGVWNLMINGRLSILQQGHWGWTPSGGRGIIMKNREILVWHHLTYITPPFPGAKEGQAIHILKKYPQFDLIVTGDNHQSFWTEHEGRLLVNPGSLTRQKADQINFEPRVYLWYADTNTVDSFKIPIKEGVISREHIKKKEEHSPNLDAFVDKLDGKWDIEFDFEQKLKIYFEHNETREPIKQIIWRTIE